MAYPNAEDYVRAVQQPEQVFRVPALRKAVFELHPLFGIPMPASGNVAVVFKANMAGEDTALRFFIREDASSRERYAALGRHFADRGIDDCVAHPTWIDQAISINGATWPMVQMSWVDGRTLDAYVGHLAGTGNVGGLVCLAETWRGLIARLQAAEFAHGDLQHGNVLIDTSSTLRLVDFDGSWIAAFHGGPPPKETGHPNYQRTGREWGKWMDTFPGLVIYTALLALSRRPESWAELHNGENILFSAEDFDPPFRTRTWQFLSGLRDAEVDHAAERLMRACDPTWQAGNTLESLLDGRPRVEIPAQRKTIEATPFPGVAAQTDRGTPWWERAGGTAGAAGTPGPRAPSGVAAPPPTASAMPPPPPKQAPGTATTPASPSFAGAGPAQPWYQPSGQGPRPHPAPRPPAHQRSGGAIALRVLAIAALTALLVGALSQNAAAGLLAAVIAAGIALPILLSRRT